MEETHQMSVMVPVQPGSKPVTHNLGNGLLVSLNWELWGDTYRLKAMIHQAWDHLSDGSLLLLQDKDDEVFGHLLVGIKHIAKRTVKKFFDNLPQDRELMLCIFNPRIANTVQPVPISP